MSFSSINNNKSSLQAHSYSIYKPNYTQENPYNIKMLIVNILVSPSQSPLDITQYIYYYNITPQKVHSIIWTKADSLINNNPLLLNSISFFHLRPKPLSIAMGKSPAKFAAIGKVPLYNGLQ